VVLLGLLLVVLIGLPIFFVFGRRRKKKKESETR
jgi:preprotein translocase subunit YajC